MKPERPVETVEEFKLRIAAIIYYGRRYFEIKFPRTTTRTFEERKKAISQKRFALIVQILSAPEAAIGTTNLHYQLRLQHSSWLTTRLTLQFCVKPSIFTASSKLLAHHQPYRFALAG